MSDPETKRALLWAQKKELNVGSITLPSGEVIYEFKYYPTRTIPSPVYNKVTGLGSGFATWRYDVIREFLDDYLRIKDILTLGTTSREWNYFTSDEKLWKRYGRRKYKGNFEFCYSWKASVIENHRKKRAKRDDRPYHKTIRTPPDRSIVPWYDGMEDETVHDFKLWSRAATNPKYLEATTPVGQIDKISADDITVEEFIEKYERPGVPVIITGLTDNWPAAKNWTQEKLCEEYGDVRWRTGSGFKMNLSRFFLYLKRHHDMQPLYLFDQNYPTKAPPMAEEYKIPKFFPEDLFEIVGEDDRPPYRWILIAGSGVPFHTDPRGTSAWNTVLFGKKRWAFYPPHVTPPGVGPNHSDYYDAPTAVKWYHKFLPALEPNNRPIEVLQEAGDTIFVPSQWWHMVYNAGPPGTVVTAVTHNYASTANFDYVIPTLWEDKDDEFRPKFKAKLKEHRPDLFKRITEWESSHGMPWGSLDVPSK